MLTAVEITSWPQAVTNCAIAFGTVGFFAAVAYVIGVGLKNNRFK